MDFYFSLQNSDQTSKRQILENHPERQKTNHFLLSRYRKRKNNLPCKTTTNNTMSGHGGQPPPPPNTRPTLSYSSAETLFGIHDRSSNHSGGGGGLPDQPTTSGMAAFSLSSLGFSPGPMTLVSNLFPDGEECKSFSQLLAGAIYPPIGASSSGLGDFRPRQHRPERLSLATTPPGMFSIPSGLSPTALLDSPGFSFSSAVVIIVTSSFYFLTLVMI